MSALPAAPGEFPVRTRQLTRQAATENRRTVVHDDYTHAQGSYIGNGQTVHAGRSGDVIEVVSLDYMPSFHSARRLA
jgi:hypothetical protein